MYARKKQGSRKENMKKGRKELGKNICKKGNKDQGRKYATIMARKQATCVYNKTSKELGKCRREGKQGTGQVSMQEKQQGTRQDCIKESSKEVVNKVCKK